MTANEEERRRLFQRLEEVLGATEAATLMEGLPPIRWSDLATKADLDGLRAATKADLDQLQAETKAEFERVRSETRNEFEKVRSETRNEFEKVRSETRNEFEKVGLRMEVMEHRLMSAFRDELNEAFHRQGRQTALTLVGSLTGLSALAWTIANLAH